MEIIISLLKQLASSLSPTEFLVAVIVIIATTLSGIKFALGLLGKGGKGGFLTLLTGSGAGPSQSDIDSKILHEKLTMAITDITTKMDALVTREHLLAYQEVANEQRLNTTQQVNDIRGQLTDIGTSLRPLALMHQDMEKTFADVTQDLNDIKNLAREHDNRAEKNFTMSREQLQRTQDIVARVSAQVEKIDEFVRSSVPEFRSYHKELTNELKDLSKDLAVIERTLQTQINTGSAVKLR